MGITFERAVRHRAKARIGLSGPSGSGKTYSAIRLAQGMGKKIAVIDTEHGSAELYSHLGEYYSHTLEPPFTPKRYRECIHAAEKAGFDVIVIDSLSHAWSGEGGSLDTVDRITGSKGNKWAAWRTVTPEHNALVEAILQSPAHIIATTRAKQEYEQVEENGKKVIRRVGMAPIMRDGIEYEFTMFGELTIPSHMVEFTKNRTQVYNDGVPFLITEETGMAIVEWFMNAPPEAPPAPTPAPPPAQPEKSADSPENARVGDNQPGPEPAPEDHKGLDPETKKRMIRLREARESLGKHLNIPVTESDTRSYIHARFGLTSHKDMNEEQFTSLMGWLRRCWEAGRLVPAIPEV